jgi:hypothetical protein
LRLLFEVHGGKFRQELAELSDEIGEFGSQILSAGETTEEADEAASARSQERIRELQQADRRYWRGVIAELKTLRANGQLMPEGDPV